MVSTAIGSPHSSPSPQPPPPKFGRAASSSSVASSTSSRKRSYDDMSDTEDDDCIPRREPLHPRIGLLGWAGESLARIFDFAFHSRPANSTSTQEGGDNGQPAESEVEAEPEDEAAAEDEPATDDEATTEDKEVVSEDQAKHIDTTETATQRATGGNSDVPSRVDTERLKIGIPGPDEISIKKLPAHHQLPSPLASEDETPIRKVVSYKPLLSKKLGQLSMVEDDGITAFRFEQPEKPFNPKRRPRKKASQIYESALIRRDQLQDVKSTLRRNRQQASKPGTPGRGQIRKPIMGIPFSRKTPHSASARPSDRLVTRVTKPDKKESRTIRAIERARDAGIATDEILRATLRQLQSETYGFQKLDAARVRQREIDAEVERIRAEAEWKAREEKKRAQQEAIKPLRGKELEEAKKIFVRVKEENQAKKEVTYTQAVFKNPPETIPIGTYILSRVIRLEPYGGWLNDEAINSYCRLVFERERHRTMIFSHYFFNSLKEHGYKKVQNYAKRRGFPGMKILECQYVIIPINEGDVHWTLAAINPPARRFEYYDSVKQRNASFGAFHCMREYLRGETGGKVNLDEWEDYVMQDYPQQRNGSDCGIFTTKTCEILARGGIPNYSSLDIQHVRLRMLWELAHMRLLPVDYGKEDDGKGK